MKVTTAYGGQAASTNCILNETSSFDYAAEISSDYQIKDKVNSPVNAHQFLQLSINEIWEIHVASFSQGSGTQMLHLPRDVEPLPR